tara:strand:- start:691 stop:849 length:159 start_codon:yes stop_codon:yes gene_type:complete
LIYIKKLSLERQVSKIFKQRCGGIILTILFGLLSLMVNRELAKSVTFYFGII